MGKCEIATTHCENCGSTDNTEEIPDPDPRQLDAFERFLDSIPCSCRGEAHDECRRQDEP